MKKVLIIDDEEKLRNELKCFLQNNGYEVFCITEFNNILENINSMVYDIILLDVCLPNANGEYLCKEIRKNNNVPIIILTSKNTEMDELVSISYGADDFITKPYNPQILLARIERLVNRNEVNNNLMIYDNNLKLDILKSSIVYKDKIIDLSKNEFKIFYCFLQKRGTIISRDYLMDYLWDNNEFIDDNTLTVNINRLRNKLSDLGYPDIIITKRGQGYIIL